MNPADAMVKRDEGRPHMKERYIAVLSALLLIACFGMNGSKANCYAFEKALRTEEAKPDEINGTFTLILYGGSYLDDLETIAMLDAEGDQYVLDPFAPDFDYRMKKSMPAPEAFKEAEKFVNFHPSFRRSQLSRIVDNEGKVIGFEVRPLYRPIAFGVNDVLDVNYWLKEKGRVKVTIRLIPSVDKYKLPGGDAGSAGGD
jgi:hypothetical protein